MRSYPVAETSEVGTPEDPLISIAHAVFSQTAEPFFHALVEHLATSLGVRFAFLCHLDESKSMSLKPLAFRGDPKLEGHINRHTIERLCQRIGTSECTVSSADVKRLFPDDRWIWQEGIRCCVAIALTDKSGRLLGHLGVLDDKHLEESNQVHAALQIVASRAAAEIERLEWVRQLRESEQKFRSICAAALDAIVVTNETGQVAFWSDRAQELFGYAPDEATGQNVHALLAPAHYHRDIARGLAKFRSTGKGPVVNRVNRLMAVIKGGEEIPIELSISSVQVKGRWHAIGTVRDIRDRERAEATLKASSDKVRRLAAHLQHIREEERRTMAREIHDELGHALTALKIDLVRLQQRLDPLQHDLHAMVGSMLGSANAAVAVVQRLASELRPAILDDLGLVAAIEWLTEQFQKRTGIICSLALPAAEPALDEKIATALFRIVQEALTNVSRHAGASAVAVSLAGTDHGHWTITVADDGRGISEEEAQGPDALGLLGMQERAYAIGGELRVRGIPGQGTRVSVHVPPAT